MAVITMYKVDRDGALFADRKQAQEHDDMLALAEAFTAILERHAPGISGDAAEEAGIFLARHRAEVAVACKGKPDVLTELLTTADAGTDDQTGSASIGSDTLESDTPGSDTTTAAAVVTEAVQLRAAR